MPRNVCQGVLLAVLPLTAACFLSHGDDDPRPARGDDAGPPPSMRDASPAPVRDAGPPPRWDAGPSPRDAGTPSDCFTDPIPARIDRACVPTDTGFAPAGSNFNLDVALDGCFCDGAVYCAASLAEDGVIELETTQCPDSADCDSCIPSLTTSCAIPPLTAGIWTVLVNGTPAFDLRAMVGEPGLVGRRVCHDVAPDAEGSFICPWPGDFEASSTETCHPVEARPGRPVPIRVTDTCGGCFDVEGSCEVAVSLNDITVTPRTRSCDCPVCGACAEVCGRTEVTCHTPPLEPGVYTVRTPTAETTLEVSADASHTPSEICAGSASGGGTGPGDG